MSEQWQSNDYNAILNETVARAIFDEVHDNRSWLQLDYAGREYYRKVSARIMAEIKRIGWLLPDENNGNYIDDTHEGT
jgi:hypothetical protein